jgi:hypothetical protein
MLVLFGPSRTGKSKLGRHLYGENCTLVIDVQHAVHPDMHEFRREEHKAVQLDEVSGPQFVVDNKKLLQAHIDGAILGQSATQLYTYKVWLWRVPLILTTNYWEYDEFRFADRNWIQANCVEVYVDEPVWDDNPPVEASLVSPRSEVGSSSQHCPRRVWHSPGHGPSSRSSDFTTGVTPTAKRLNFGPG